MVAHSLSGRLLLLTVLYALASEVLIFVPAIGLYHRELLTDHVLSAQLAIQPFTEPGGQDLPGSLRDELLKHADADAVVLRRNYRREFFPIGHVPTRIDRTIDLTSDTLLADMNNGMDCLLYGGGRELHIIAPTYIRGVQSIGVMLDERPLRSALLVYAGRAVVAALFISWVTAALVFASLYAFLVRPMRRITRAMVAFRENPEDADRIIAASQHAGEIGLAERELAAMQRDLYGFLRQKARLAALGAAVARLQHELRNILASAQLASDRLAASNDPAVKRLTPGLVASIGRAVALATNTLKFGGAEERIPRKAPVALRALADEAAQSVLGPSPQIVLDNRIDAGLLADADREQLFRMILNLVRNAAQALASCQSGAAITVSAVYTNRSVQIDVADNGPGVPKAVLGKLFEPFASAAGGGGTGLGLAIARDLARGHGGDLRLVSTGSDGTVFRIIVPSRD
ncbi:MAG: HAMP domain-containing histidine kinase [Alphaproteobacteria bacterium]|nr:HAMP domain-containing histidine kinase [Alphaproteobacteria bacterium]MDE2629445.1 HAMP domain-containing histidine kinase [Alphaproteobacteria bacterium]